MFKDLASVVFAKVARNPVLVAAVLVAVGQAIESATASGNPLTYESLVSIVVGVVVRQFVSPVYDPQVE